MRHDEEEFEKLRYALIAEVHRINKGLRKRRFAKHMAKNAHFYMSHEPTTSLPAEQEEQNPEVSTSPEDHHRLAVLRA